MRDYTLDDLCEALIDGIPNAIWVTLGIFALVALACLGPWIPFDLFQFWTWKGSLTEVLMAAWPIFLWGGGLTLIGVLSGHSMDTGGSSFTEALAKGTGISLWAGVTEEISYRWLRFYVGILGFKVMNVITFGFTEWFYVHLTGPLANFFTHGLLQGYLLNGAGYAVGAAIITANGKFRDGHQYQGLFGLINSWFLGMVFFYIMFKHGLLAAIFIHYLYDQLIFGLVALPAMGTRAPVRSRRIYR